MTEFKAFWVEKTEAGMQQQVIQRSTADLPDGEVLIRVQYSSVNYKDALSSKGIPGVTKNYPIRQASMLRAWWLNPVMGVSPLMMKSS